MTNPRERRVLGLMDSLCLAASITLVLVGCLALAGWLFGFQGLRSIHPKWGTMTAQSAFCFAVAGAALGLQREEQANRWKVRLAQFFSLLVILVSLLSLGSSIFGWKLDSGLIGAVFPGRMPMPPALAFLSLGLALLLLDYKVHERGLAEFLSFAAALIAVLALISYVFSFVSFSAISGRRPLAFHALLLFLILSMGILAARPRRGFMALAMSETVGGVMMRRLWPAAIGIPVMAGWVILEGQRAGYYPPALNLPFYALLIIVVFGTLIWLTGGSLHRIDLQKQSAEAQIHRLNAELEQRVVERTAQLASANSELEHLKERYRLLFESNPHPAWVYDLETLRILDVNEVALRHYGYSREEFLHSTIKDIRPSEDIPAVLASVAAAATEVDQAGEWRHRKKDGSIIDVEIASHALVFAGRPARLVVATDITDRKRAEQAVRESEERFRSVAETATDAILSADAAGNIVYFNRAAERIFGHAAADVLGRPLTLLMPARFRQLHRDGFQRYLATGDAHVVGKTVELSGMRKDGTEFPLELSLASWKTRDDTFFTGILSDITHRKQAEQEILERSAQLEAANRELEAFSYSVSHDLRAPLRSIDGFSQILQEDYGDKLDKNASDALLQVRLAAGHMAQLIEDLLNLARVTRAEMQRAPVNLSALARSIAEGLRRGAPDRAVEFVITEGLQAEGDPGLLRVVLDNLLGNAWKFTSHHDRAKIEFDGTHCDGQRVFFVRDDGAGFDAAYVGRLFGPFKRLHSDAEFAGTGIGLAIVNRIVQRHGGRVWAEGAVERGATFFFSL